MLRILYSRPVGIMLGAPERAYLASPLRPVDLADLEALSYTAWGNPAELLPDKDEDTPEGRQALKDALDLAEAGPASWRTTTDPQLASATTLAFLRSVLRAHEDLTDSDFSTLAHQLTPKQWTRLYRVAWGVDPVREIIQRIDTLLGFPPEPCDGVPWCVAIAELANETGWTLEQIGQIPLPASNLMRNGGKPVDPWDSGPESPIIGDVGSPLQKAREAFFNG
jgi:hypothetical protein